MKKRNHRHFLCKALEDTPTAATGRATARQPASQEHTVNITLLQNVNNSNRSRFMALAYPNLHTVLHQNNVIKCGDK